MTAVSNNLPGAVLPPGSRLGRYEILAKLAAGGMAVVYVARVQGVAGFQRLVALKVLHSNLAHEEEFIAMFLDEARLAARIRHPNVVGTIDISDSAEAGYYLVMDYIEGDHLGRLLAAAHKAGERISVRLVLRIVADALSGLGCAHDLCDDSGRRLNLVHRDVSPHNIMVGTDGVARLTDFGVAKAEDRIAHTRDGQVKGKLAYMAPEQASTGESDNRSDLFAMGVILWECLTGRRLFRGDNAAATLNKLINEPIPPPSTVDPALEPLDPVVLRALDRDPNARFTDAEAFLTALERAGDAFGGLASQREVARLVRDIGGDKIARDRRMIRSAEAVVDNRIDGDEMLSEPSLLSRTSLSNASFSQSASKLSGAFSQQSAVSFRAQASTGSGTGSLPPPPPAAMAGDVAPAPEGRSGRGRRAGLYLRFAVLLVGAAAFGLVYSLTAVEDGTVEATPITAVDPVVQGRAEDAVASDGVPPVVSLERVPGDMPAAPRPEVEAPSTNADRGSGHATEAVVPAGAARVAPTVAPSGGRRARRSGRAQTRVSTSKRGPSSPAETDLEAETRKAQSQGDKPSKQAAPPREPLDDLLLDNPYQD